MQIFWGFFLFFFQMPGCGDPSGALEGAIQMGKELSVAKLLQH